MTIIERSTMRAPGAGGRGGVSLAGVPRWSHVPCLTPTEYPGLPSQALYPYDPEINDRLAIWKGDISALEVDAITNTTDNTLSESNAISDRIMNAAGPGLKEEIIIRGLECNTGEAVITPGFELRCRRVIHTVCPRYLHKYHAASEAALQQCYNVVLSAAREVGSRSVALCVLGGGGGGGAFPPDRLAHIALDTIRRFLEQNKSPQLVIIASESGPDVAVFTSIAPLYFPQTPQYAPSSQYAPSQQYLHTPHYERAVDERRIRIIHNPHSTSADSAEDESSYDSSAAAEAAAAFGDTQRLLAPPARAAPRPLAARDQHQYERLLRRARTEDLSSVSGIGCLYQSGVDRLGRPVVVFIGKWFPIGDIDLDKALLYLVLLMEPIVRGDYVIAYFHTLASAANHPPFYWLKEVYSVLPYKYKKNLKAFYIIHPTFWTKMMTWWFTTFMAPAIKAKVHTLPGVEFLYSVMARDQLELPAFITEYDMTINGLHYFQPDTTSNT